VLCWGNNQQGQVGDGSQIQQLAPAQVYGITGGATSVTAGGFHTCALVNSGVRCWGFNSFGQLGNGLTTLSKVPVNVSGLTGGVITVVAGGVNYDEEHTCAITNQNSLKCWGGNEYGQLGDNLSILHTAPIRVLGLATGPEIGQNYASGRLGSYFRIALANFPPAAALTVRADGKYMGTIIATGEGYAIFHIVANASPSPSVQVSVNTGATSLNTSLNIASNQPLHLMEGTAPIYALSPAFQYLPLVTNSK
jgi:alpha-tubulin suppressor-like RCC1 family protein